MDHITNELGVEYIRYAGPRTGGSASAYFAIGRAPADRLYPAPAPSIARRNVSGRRLVIFRIGDLALWIDGTTVRALHLCDRRVTTLGSIPTAERMLGGTWSPDGRYFSLYSGMTDDDHGPSWLIVADTALGRLAQVAQPWVSSRSGRPMTSTSCSLDAATTTSWLDSPR